MKKIYIVIIIFCTAMICWILYNKLFFLNIVVKFNDLEPMEQQMNVYYKGFKIGKTLKIYPDKDFQNTYLKLKIKPRNINLPSNISATIKQTPSKSYINIVLPDNPNIERIKNNMIISGIPAKDIKRAINESLEEEDIDMIIDEAATLMESTNSTVQQIGETFRRINFLLDNINEDIKQTTGNLSKTTKNVSDISDKFNNSISEEQIKKSINNMEEMTENVKNTTYNLNNISEEIENTTIPTINSILCETNSTMENTEEITYGIKETLKKRFGMMKLMFGKPINNKCN